MEKKQPNEFIEFLMTYGWAIIVVVIAFGLLGYFGVFSPSKSNYTENQDILPVDQLSSCYKGCQFATQPNYNITPIEDQNIRVRLYWDCCDLCKIEYYFNNTKER